MKKITLFLTLLLIATISFGQNNQSQTKAMASYEQYIKNKGTNPVSQNAYISTTIENLKHK